MDADTGTRLATVAVFVWVGVVGFGLVLAVSYLEVPLTFRIPGITRRIGPSVGALIFRVLSACEYVFAVVAAFALFTHETSVEFNVAVFVAVGALLAQTIVVRPLLSRRSAAAPDGDERRLSSAHLAYLALEVAKLAALIWTCVLLVEG